MSEPRLALVTGANSGIGRTTALGLADAGLEVLCACRSERKGTEVVDEIAARGGLARFVSLDLASLDAVVACAKARLDEGRPLSLLVNNAGLASAGGKTVDGFETAFGVNHLGHFVLTQHLRPLLVQAAPARVIQVASRSHYDAKTLDLDDVTTPQRGTGLPEYARSKLCNVLFAQALDERWATDGVRSFSLHPGVVATEAWRRIPRPLAWLMKRFMISAEEGAKTTLHCALAPGLDEHGGAYFDECAPKRPSRLARQEGLSTTLWERSETLAADWLPGGSLG